MYSISIVRGWRNSHSGLAIDFSLTSIWLSGIKHSSCCLGQVRQCHHFRFIVLPAEGGHRTSGTRSIGLWSSTEESGNNRQPLISCRYLHREVFVKYKKETPEKPQLVLHISEEKLSSMRSNFLTNVKKTNKIFTMKNIPVAFCSGWVFFVQNYDVVHSSGKQSVPYLYSVNCQFLLLLSK